MKKTTAQPRVRPSAAAAQAQPASASAHASGAAFRPLYQQIKTLILQSLQSGEWRPSSAIPSENELAARYQVSQGTVRKAIDALAAENLLLRRQGRGTFVATHAQQHAPYRFLRLFPNTVVAQGQTLAQRTIIGCTRTRSPSNVASALGLRKGEAVLEIQRVLSFAGVPTILEDIWLPASHFEGLSAERLNAYDGPLYALFEAEFNVHMVRAEEKIRAVLPNAEQCLHLQTSAHTPLLSVERTAYTYNDVAMELRQGLYLTNTHHYRNSLN